jgi:hypothetical protein
MRFDQNSMSLWYGTPDAPAPAEIASAGAEISITIGVQPATASNNVEVLYRTNQGPTQRVMARFFRNDINSKAQYFVARLPAFRAGDTVEYGARCQCVGRQVPSPDEQKQLPSSFRVVQTEAKEAGLIAGLAVPKTLAPGRGLVTAVARETVPPGTTLLPPQPKAGLALGTQVASVAAVPPPFQPPTRNGVGHAALSSLLSTSPTVAAGRLQQKVIDLHAAHEGPIRDFWNKLRQEPDFKAPGVVEEIQFTLQVGLLTGNHVPLVKALQGLRQRGEVKSPKDLAQLDVHAWTHLITTSANGQLASVPPTVSGTTAEEKTANYAKAITNTLRTAFPTTAFARSLATPPAVDLGLVKTVLARNPGLSPADHPPANLDLTEISPEDQARAKASLTSLRQEIKTFPAFDHQTAVAATTGGTSARVRRAEPATTTGSPRTALQNPIRTGVTQFLANSPDFDFRSTHIDSYLASNAATAFQGVPEADRTAVADQLKRQQRVFRITPDHAAVNTLMAAGLHSAYSIASIPQSVFLQQFSDQLGGHTEAMAIHSQALHVSSSALNVYAQVHQALHDVTPRVIGAIADDVKDILKQHPNWQTLFGSLSFCDCGHCRSVYSPAAYFVDLLQFLSKSASNAAGKTPLAVLLGRRPDLQYIKLNCENTNTLIPYVDLVNEILESYVALGKPDQTAAHDTGDTTADEIGANPQYVNDKAYDRLKRAVYPLALPFNRPLEVARTYLEHLGSSRYQVMKTFQTGRDRSDLTKGNPPVLAIACEYLKISEEEYAILTGTDFAGVPTSRKLSEFYGYSPNTKTGDLVASLTPVPEFLRATGISYLDLVELVKTRFLNPNQAITLNVPSEADPCDLKQTTIKSLDESTLKKMHRFIRLRRKLGWQVRELDKAMTALRAADIDDALLYKLAHLKRLQAGLNLPLNQLLSFWADIDTNGRDSLYIKLFQNKSVLHPVDPAFSLNYAVRLESPPKLTDDSLKSKIPYDEQNKRLQFSGTMTADERVQLLAASSDGDYQLAVDSLYQMRVPDGADLPGNAFISDHVNTILAALRVSAVDLAAIRAATGSAKSIPPGLDDADGDHLARAPLNVENLSILYRHAGLAKSLKLSVKDLLALLTLIGINPFQAADPASTAHFVDQVEKLRQSPFSVAQLNYLYRQAYDPSKGIAPLQSNVDRLLTDLQGGLKKIVDDTTVVPDPTGDLLRQKLALVLDASLVDPAMSLIGGTTVYSAPLANPPGVTFPGALINRISYDPAVKQLRFTGIMTDAQQTTLLDLSTDKNYQTAIKKMNMFQSSKDFIGAHLAFLDSADAISHLVGTPSIAAEGKPDGPAIAAKFEYVLTRVMANLRDTQSRSLIKQTLSDNLKLDPGLIGLLLETVLKSHTDGSKTAMADFLGLIGDGFSAALQSYRLLHKIALLVKTFKMTVPEVAYLSAHGLDFKGVDPADPADQAKWISFDLNNLPLDSFNFRPALFNQWERLRDLFTLRDSLPVGEVGLLEVFGAPSADEAQAKLTLATGWDSKELAVLTGAEGFKFGGGDYQTEVRLVSLQSCWSVMKRLGVSATQLFDWASKPPFPCQAQEIKNTVKAKYDDKTWLTVAKPLNDKLRESQKAALISYLLTLPQLMAEGIRDSSGLYEYFLIDVDMSACMMTSRIVQANSSVQLLVQRCLMNLEPAVCPSAIDDRQWKWMKYYRAWEANRKVFLYPENWVESGLRDNKTPPFMELESELLQNDVTTDTAEIAILSYLEKLDQVAHPEICGMYWQEEDTGTPDEVNILHVFGRTFAIPHIYYHRKLVNDGTWTPWEKVQADIEGDHLIPVVWSRRLYLFWPIFTEKTDPKDNKLSAPPSQPQTHCEIQLAWSEYKDGKWLPKRISTSFIISGRVSKQTRGDPQLGSGMTPDKSIGITITEIMEATYLPEAKHHFFKATTSQDDHSIHVWRRFSVNVAKSRSIETTTKTCTTSDPPICDPPKTETTNPVLTNEEMSVAGYEYLGYFAFNGCNGRVDAVSKPSELGFDSLQNPLHSENSFMSYVAEDSAHHLTLLDAGAKPVRVLGKTAKIPSPYTMLALHQQPRPHADWSYYPFFYQDKQRAYLATPDCVDPCVQLSQPDAVEPVDRANDRGFAVTETPTSSIPMGDTPRFNTPGPVTEERGMMATTQPRSGTAGISASTPMPETQRE